MKYRQLLCTAIAFSYFLTTSCNSSTTENKEATVTEEQEQEETTDFADLVEDWSKAHSNKDVGAFSSIYNNSILFYGTLQTKNECIESKLDLFKKYPNFKQEISSDIKIENINETEVNCSFIKSVTINDKTSDYPSYLTFQNVGNDWKIIVEGDDVTDENLKKKATEVKNKEYVYYIPQEVSGTLSIETFYGRPNFGGNPETDEKVKHYVLVLDKPIDIIAETDEPEEGIYEVTKRGVSKMQLLVPRELDVKPYMNKSISLRGSFFAAHTAYHYTDVLMDVKDIVK